MVHQFFSDFFYEVGESSIRKVVEPDFWKKVGAGQAGPKMRFWGL